MRIGPPRGGARAECDTGRGACSDDTGRPADAEDPGFRHAPIRRHAVLARGLPVGSAQDTGLRKWLAGGALAVASMLLTLVLVEAYLRSTRSLETFFDPVQYEPELASEGWKRSFVRDYAKLRKSARMGTDLGGYVHDPDLGWDTPRHFRGVHGYQADKQPDVFRVVVIGDSFTYGAEVSDDETYPHRLEMLLPKGEVINLGVRAYGIDQAVLKYLKYGRAYRPDLLVVGIWSLDYLRTPLTFYRFAKPLYVIDPGTHALTLTRTPVPPPDDMYRMLERELGPFFFTYGLLRQAYRMKFPEARGLERYFEKWDPLIEAILGRLVEAARQDHTPMLFVLIETGMAFRTDELMTDTNTCCERKHLRDIVQRLSVDAIDVGETLPRKYSRSTVYERMYIHHRGDASGHFTPFGNEAVAQEIGDYIQERFGVAVTGTNLLTGPAPHARNPRPYVSSPPHSGSILGSTHRPRLGRPQRPTRFASA